MFEVKNNSLFHAKIESKTELFKLASYFWHSNKIRIDRSVMANCVGVCSLMEWWDGDDKIFEYNCPMNILFTECI
jgi:hypothetical protein